MVQRVNVLRNKPRSRQEIGLAGIIETRLVSESYIHIGSAQPPLKVDEDKLKRVIQRAGPKNMNLLSKVIRFEERIQFNICGGIPTIPGSSVKGNIRSRLELSFRPKGGYVKSCFLRATRPLERKVPMGQHGWRHSRIWGEVLFEDRGPPCDLTRNDTVCLVCDLFGTTGLKSLVDFGDFKGYGVELESLDLDYGMKVYAAKPGSEFRGIISFINLSISDLGLLFIGMRAGGSALLGRLKYRSVISGYTFGKVKYVIDGFKLWDESRPLEIGGLIIKPGEKVEGERLAHLIEMLKTRAYKEYEGEISDVDEVALIERLSRS